MRAANAITYVVGLGAIAWLLTRLPDDVWQSTRAFLVVAIAAILVFVVLAIFLTPARRALASAFMLPLSFANDAPWLAMPSEQEWAVTVRPVVVVAALFAVVTVGSLLR